jgi:two-component system cell cycle sensor histidine kinase/response regulator CckA
MNYPMSTPNQTKGTVLVVDDDDDLRFLITEALASEGYTVIEAENGADALDVLVKSRPDVIVLDMMPIMDGPTFVAKIRERDPRHPPIIVSSSMPEMAPKGLPVVHKPVNTTELFRVVATALPH